MCSNISGKVGIASIYLEILAETVSVQNFNIASGGSQNRTMVSKGQIICAIIIHFAGTIAFFSMGFYFGNRKIPLKKCNNFTRTEQIIHSPYNLLSNETMTEFLLKVPINARQLREIIIYEGNVMIGRIPGDNMCDLRARLINCSPGCIDYEVSYLTAKETEEFSRLLDGMIQCTENCFQ